MRPDISCLPAQQLMNFSFEIVVIIPKAFNVNNNRISPKPVRMQSVNLANQALHSIALHRLANPSVDKHRKFFVADGFRF